MAYALPRHELLVDKHDIKRSEPLENLDSSEPKKPNEGNKKANSATKKPCENVKPTKDDIFFAPAGSKFVIVDTKDKKDQKFQIRFKKIELSTNDDYRRAGRCIVHEDYTKYEVALADSDYRFSHGLTHGPLTLPFKLQLSDGNVLASGNIGYFMGYRWRYLTFVLPAFGFNIVKPDNTTSGEQKSVIALTAAFGIAYDLTQSMLEIGSGVQFGVFFGIDHANGYAYSGKPWISMGIGYNFNIKGD